jgi:hypothetical protein
MVDVARLAAVRAQRERVQAANATKGVQCHKIGVHVEELQKQYIFGVERSQSL